MLTQRAIQLRGEIDEIIRAGGIDAVRENLSRMMLNELIIACEPTAEEFDAMAKYLKLSAGDLFRLIRRFGANVRE